MVKQNIKKERKTNVWKDGQRCGEGVILQRQHKALKIVPKGTGSRTASFIIHS